MVATTILYFLPKNQSPKRSNGACGPPSPVWQGLRAPVACAPLVMSLPCTVDSAAPRSCSDDGGGERKGVCAAVANASGRDRDLSETPRSSKVYRSSGRPGYGQSPHGTVLIIEPEAGLRTLLREVLELEGYDAVEAAHSYEGLQAADVALPEGVTLDIRYLII
jgi:hypothetical protein